MDELPIIKLLIIGAFVLIVLALASAGISLFRKDSAQGTSTVKALTVRVGLSLVLVLTILVLHQLGLISPNG